MVRLVQSWTRTNEILEAYNKAGMKNDLLFRVCGEIEEAICILVGEGGEDLEKTTTHIALTSPIISEERRVKLLMSRFRVSYPGAPALLAFSDEPMEEIVRKNGGYCPATGYVAPRETPEGEWKP